MFFLFKFGLVEPKAQKPTLCAPIAEVRCPEDGLPVCEDWIGTFESMLLGGVELQREPLDISMRKQSGWSEETILCLLVGCGVFTGLSDCQFMFGPLGSWPMAVQMVDQIKGWTRSSVVMIILTAASELDLSDPSSVEKLKPLFPCLDKCWLLPTHVFWLELSVDICFFLICF